MNTNEYLQNATAAELEEYLRQYLWKSMPNYSGTVFEDHAIVHMTHDQATIEDEANYLTLENEDDGSLVFATFEHYKYGNLKMVLIPLHAAYESLRYAAINHAEIMSGGVLCPADLATVEEEQMQLLWAQMTADEREALAIKAGKTHHQAKIEREQSKPDFMHDGTIVLLQSLIYEQEGGVLV